MLKFLNVLVALIALFFVLMWLGWMLKPQDMAQNWGLTANSIMGLNNLRGDIGGLFLAGGVFSLLALRGGTAWLHAAAVSMACVVVGRAAGLVLDGFDRQALVSLLIELAFIAVFLATARARRQP